MSNVLPFLLELGVEEIPHWMIVPALGEVERLFRESILTRIAPVTEQLILSFIAEKVLDLPKSY